MTTRKGQKVACGDLNVVTLAIDLVGALHATVEEFEHGCHESRVSDPGTVVSIRNFALLVVHHFSQSGGVLFFVVLDRDLRGHTSHGVRTTPVASLDEQERIGSEKVGGHGDQGSIGQCSVRIVGELFDHAENVIPAPAIESSRVLSELVEDFVHLEGGRDRLDQNGRLDGADGKPDVLLRKYEHVVPEPCLEVILQLGNVEVRTASLLDQRFRVMEEEQAEIEERCGDRSAVDCQVLLGQVKTARTHDECGDFVVETILLPGGSLEFDRSTHGVA